MKKRLILTLLPLLAISVTGCGSTGGDTPTPTPEPTPVVSDEVVSVKITNLPTDNKILVGASVTLGVDIVTRGNAAKTVSWSSSSSDVATVENGVVKALKAGKTTIVAKSTFDNTKSDSFELTVNDQPEVVSVKIKDAPSSVDVGDSINLNVDVITKGGASNAVTWSIDKSNLAYVDQNGLLTTKGEGTVIITARSTFDVSKSDSVSINIVLTPKIKSVTILDLSDKIYVGYTIQLTASVDSVGSISKAVTWSVDNTSIASISSSGMLSALAEGEIVVTARSVADNTKFGTASASIVYEPVEKTLSSISATGAKTTYIVGEYFSTNNLVVKAFYSDDSSKEVTNYTYSPTSALKLTDTKVTISYTEGEITKTTNIPITVSEEPVTKYTLYFETNGGSSITPITVDAGESISKPSDPTKDGYHFVSWCTDSTLKTEVSWPLTISKDTTVYAKWNEKVDMKGYLKTALDALKSKPSDFLPESMVPGSEESLANLDTLKTDFSTNTNVSAIQTSGYGEQWMMILDNVEQSDSFFKVIKLGEAIISASVVAFNNWFDANPASTNKSFDETGYAASVSYTKGVLVYSIQIKSGISVPLFGEITPRITVTWNVSETSKEVIINATNTNVMKYVADENAFALALEYGIDAGHRTSMIEMEVNDEGELNGIINEFITLKGKDCVKSCAMFYADEDSLIATGNKASAIVAMNGTLVEVYSVETGKLLGYKVSESRDFPVIGTVAYNTLWFNMNQITGISSLKAIAKEGTVAPNVNDHEVYVNGSTKVFEPAYNKKVTVKTSRKYDIEMRSHTYYGLNGDVLTRVDTKIPMMFIQDDNDDNQNFTTFPDDMNKVSGISGASVNILASDLKLIRDSYNEYIPAFQEIKDTKTSEDITNWIGIN